MKRFHVRVDPKFTFNDAACCVCKATVHVDPNAPTTQSYICFSCARDSGLDVESKSAMLDDLMTQLCAITTNQPSKLPIPSWTEIFGNDTMKGEQPRSSLEGGLLLLVHACALYGKQEPLRLALQRWPNSVNVVANEGGTPLHLAVRWAAKRDPELKCARLLLEAKADPNIAVLVLL